MKIIEKQQEILNFKLLFAVHYNCYNPFYIFLGYQCCAFDEKLLCHSPASLS